MIIQSNIIKREFWSIYGNFVYIFAVQEVLILSWYNVLIKFIVIFYSKTKLILKPLISFTFKHYSLFSPLNEEHVKWFCFMARPEWNDISLYWCNIFCDEQQTFLDPLTLFNTHTTAIVILL